MMSKAFLVGTSLFFAAHTAHADPADLDTTFDTDGKVSVPFGAVNGTGAHTYAVKVQSDGKIVTAGDYDDNWAITRFTSAGALDTTFNSDGKVTTNYGGIDSASGLAIQSDGKIVAVGTSFNTSTAHFTVCLTRYLTNGTHDTTFSGDGKVAMNFGFADASASAVAIQSDGKILVAGTVTDATLGGSNYFVARFNSDGTLDTTFSSDGWVEQEMGGTLSEDIPAGIAIQSDGKIVVAGTSSGYGSSPTPMNISALRLNSDGTRDLTFDSDGKVYIDLGALETVSGVALQSDGKIVICGSYNASGAVDFLAVRLTTSGALDTSFSSDGWTTTNFTGTDLAHAVAIQSDGKIVVVGETYSSGVSDVFAVARYNTNGSLDTGFSSDGKTTTAFSGALAYAVDIQSNGKIVVAGSDGENIALARYVGTPVSPVKKPRVPTDSTPTSSVNAS